MAAAYTVTLTAMRCGYGNRKQPTFTNFGAFTELPSILLQATTRENALDGLQHIALASAGHTCNHSHSASLPPLGEASSPSFQTFRRKLPTAGLPSATTF